MARAHGARAQMALAFETVYGTAPATGYRTVPFASTTLGSEQPLIASELLGQGRDPLAPIKDAVTADGDVVVPIDVENFGLWLKAAFGQPTTTGTTPKTHTFQSGNWALPSMAIETAMDEGTTTLAWCWRITRADEMTFGFTDHDRTLAFDGTEFEPESGLTASEVRSGSDLSVDAQDAQGVLSSDRITETDILDGRWDNAAVEVWRVNWANPSQRVLLRRGAIGQIRRGRLAFVAEVRSLAHVLGQTVGRTFQASCDAALGDARCAVNLEVAAFKGTGAIIDVLRDRAFTASGLASFAAGWFAFGLVEWSTGANAGRRVEVLSHDLVDGMAILTLLEAPVRPIMATDAFIVRAGCDKRIATCGSKFANVANFRGFPHIPGQDAVLRYATKDGGHDGAVL